MDSETSLAIQAIYNEFNKYCSKTTYASLNNTVTSLTNRIVTLESTISTLQTTIQKLNKLTELLDVTVVDIKEGDILQYSNNKWHNIKPSLVITDEVNALSLSALSDVKITTPTNGNLLQYNITDHKWVNVAGTTSDITSYAQIRAFSDYSNYFNTDVDTRLSSSTVFDNKYVAINNGTAIGLTVKYDANTIVLTTKSTGVDITGNLLASGELTAYKIA